MKDSLLHEAIQHTLAAQIPAVAGEASLVDEEDREVEAERSGERSRPPFHLHLPKIA